MRPHAARLKVRVLNPAAGDLGLLSISLVVWMDSDLSNWWEGQTEHSKVIAHGMNYFWRRAHLMPGETGGKSVAAAPWLTERPEVSRAKVMRTTC